MTSVLARLPLSGVAVTAALVATSAQVRVHLTVKGSRLQEPLGQPLQQPALTQQCHPLPPGLLRQSGHGLVVEHPAQRYSGSAGAAGVVPGVSTPTCPGLFTTVVIS